MKIAPTFEIRIALIGHVSAGKTTLLNALLRDKYSEVSMKRTTAGVNFFRITVPENPTSARQWSTDAPPRSAESTLHEISADNAILRASNSFQEKVFDVELDEPLCEMRDDTKLVLVDIPGINEAGSISKYRDYVAQNWETFDCAIVVMDAKHGVNSEDSIQLLRFVQLNLKEKKDIPTIILFNKVDDPDDKEQAALVDEACAEVEMTFQVTSRKEALDRMLANCQVKRDEEEEANSKQDGSDKNKANQSAAPAPTSAESTEGDSPPGLFRGKSPRDMLTEFYHKYNPAKVSEVDRLLTKYKGKEEHMFRMIAQKYEVDLSTFGLSLSGAPSGFGSPESSQTTRAAFAASKHPAFYPPLPAKAPTTLSGARSRFGSPAGLVESEMESIDTKQDGSAENKTSNSDVGPGDVYQPGEGQASRAFGFGQSSQTTRAAFTASKNPDSYPPLPAKAPIAFSVSSSCAPLPAKTPTPFSGFGLGAGQPAAAASSTSTGFSPTAGTAAPSTQPTNGFSFGASSVCGSSGFNFGTVSDPPFSTVRTHTPFSTNRMSSNATAAASTTSAKSIGFTLRASTARSAGSGFGTGSPTPAPSQFDGFWSPIFRVAPYPVFLPFSARNAYLYQTASRMDFERFKTFDKDLVEKLGREQIGKRRWSKMTDEEKYKETFESLCDPQEFKQGLESCNFDKFLAVLSHSVGGEDVQLDLLRKQINVEKDLVASPGIAEKLLDLHEKYKAVDTGSGDSVGSESLQQWFWQLYAKCEENSIREGDQTLRADVFAQPMEELVAYHGIVRKLGLPQEEELVLVRIKDLVNKHAHYIFSKKLNAKDWTLVLGSMLLFSHDKYFVDNFGSLKILLETKYYKNIAAISTIVDYPPSECLYCHSKCKGLQSYRLQRWYTYCEACGLFFSDGQKFCYKNDCKGATLDDDSRCLECNSVYFGAKLHSMDSFLGLTYASGHWVPEYPKIYKNHVTVSVPDSPSDPKHFGHLIWKFCCLMESIEANK